MSRSYPLQEARLVYHGIFDLDKLYKNLRNWFIDRDFELVEKQYKHKIPTAAGAEDEITWEAWRKVTGMVKYYITVRFKMYEMNEVDVVKEGEKKKMNKAKLLMVFSGKLEVDFSGKWGGSKFMDALATWFYTYVWRRNIENNYGDELYYTIFKVYSVAKELLDYDASYFRSAGRY